MYGYSQNKGYDGYGGGGNMYAQQSQLSVEQRKQQQRRQIQISTERKGAADTDYFWSLVRGPSGEVVPRTSTYQSDETTLFRSNVSRAEDGQAGMEVYDHIPVERSGEGADGIPELTSFDELKALPDWLYRNILLMQYSRPTPIQRHSVPLGLAGFDLMCCAQTGSGKTFAFLLPVIATLVASESRDVSALMDERGVIVRALVLAPTRELACQINVESRKLCNNSELRSTVVYGGSDIRMQLMELSSGCDVLVATPGRLLDLVDRGVICLESVEFLVLDEADKMLNMGFEPQIREVVLNRGMPSKEARRTFMFSATFASEIQLLAKEFLREYIWVTVGRVGSTVENITQTLVLASADRNHKIALLMESISATEGRTLVFVQMKKMAAFVCAVLNQTYRVQAEEIHGDRSQGQREYALRQFRNGASRVLVATDVAARGLDIPAVTHVIQFDLPVSPDDFDTYVHRIGRTGRAGCKGLASSFYVPGRDADGNARVAPLILRLLQENQQTIPDWFVALDDVRDSGASSAASRRAGQFGGQKNNSGFASRDIRGGPRFTSNQLPRYDAPPAYAPKTAGFYGNAGGGYYQQPGFGAEYYPQQYGYYDANTSYYYGAAESNGYEDVGQLQQQQQEQYFGDEEGKSGDRRFVPRQQPRPPPVAPTPTADFYTMQQQHMYPREQPFRPQTQGQGYAQFPPQSQQQYAAYTNRGLQQQTAQQQMQMAQQQMIARQRQQQQEFRPNLPSSAGGDPEEEG